MSVTFMEWLFVYGTLLPFPSEAENSTVWFADAVRGRLFDLGAFPGLVDLDDPGAVWVEGFRRLVPEEQLNGPLDQYEGVSEGLFRRAGACTRGGEQVWVYIYDRPLDQCARGPLNCWDGERGRWASVTCVE